PLLVGPALFSSRQQTSTHGPASYTVANQLATANHLANGEDPNGLCQHNTASGHLIQGQFAEIRPPECLDELLAGSRVLLQAGGSEALAPLHLLGDLLDHVCAVDQRIGHLCVPTRWAAVLPGLRRGKMGLPATR